MVENKSSQFEKALADLIKSAHRLSDHVKSINDPSQENYKNDAEKLSRIAIEVSGSKIEDIRENLISTYNLISRPKVDDEDVQFSHLLLDKLVNDVRDALLNAELAAEADGAPSPPQINPSQSSILIPSHIERGEISQIKGQIANIQSEMAAIRISGTQIGLINFQLEKMEIKLHLAEAIIEFRKFVDGLNLERNISGIKIAARQIQGWLQDKLTPIMAPISKSVDAIIAASSFALRSVASLIAKYRGQGTSNDEIWSESEISALLRDGKSVPEAASPFVRSLNLTGYGSQAVNLSEVAKLKELRYLIIGYVKDASDLRDLASLTKLKSLQFTAGGLINLDWLEDLVNLEELTVRGIARSSAKFIFSNITRLDNLKSFSLTNGHAENFPKFDAKALRDLTLIGFDCDSYDNISELKKLENITMYSIKIRNFDFLNGLEELNSLDLRNTDFPDLSPVKYLRGLTRIYINRWKFSRFMSHQVGGNIEIRGDHGGVVRAARY